MATNNGGRWDPDALEPVGEGVPPPDRESLDPREAGRWHLDALELMSEDARREAREALRRQDDADSFINEIRDGLRETRETFDEFRAGSTQWQLATTQKLDAISSTLRMLTNRVFVLSVSRIVWPSFVALAVLFLGGFAAELVWRLTLPH